MNEVTPKKKSNLNARSFLFSIAVIFALMALAYCLTFWIPAGEYPRIENADGSAMLLAVIAFLLVIGGAFNSLEHCGLMKYMLDLTTHRFGKSRYRLMAVLVMFLIAGMAATKLAGTDWKTFGKTFGTGVLNICPAVLMILMASSIKYILEEAKILDTVLHSAVGIAETLLKWVVILFIYLLVLIMNFFVASGSAKAFMMMPLIVPLAGVFGISPQLCVLAYAFGDGFSNVPHQRRSAHRFEPGKRGIRRMGEAQLDIPTLQPVPYLGTSVVRTCRWLLLI